MDTSRFAILYFLLQNCFYIVHVPIKFSFSFGLEKSKYRTVLSFLV